MLYLAMMDITKKMDRQTAGLGCDPLSSVDLLRRQDARLAKNDPAVKGRDERLRRP